MSNLKRITCYVFALLLFTQFFLVSAPAKAALIPNPGGATGTFIFTANSTASSISEQYKIWPSGHEADAVSGTHTYSGAVQISGEYLGVTGYNSGEGEGYVGYAMQGAPGILLVVRIADQKTFGFYHKMNTGNHYMAVKGKQEGSTWKVVGVYAELVDDISGINAETSKYIALASGIYGRVALGSAENQPVIGLVGADTIQNDVKFCGNATADFTGSKFYEHLPEATKSKITAGKWPDFDVKFYVLYKVGDIWTRASFKDPSVTNQFNYIYSKKMAENGKIAFETNSLKGLPTGKYKLIGLFYLRWNGGQGDETNFDVPNNSSISSLASDLMSVPNSREIFLTDVWEVNVAKVTAAMPCKDVKFIPKDIQDSNLTGLAHDDGKTVCDGLKGGFIVVMLKQAFCGLLLVTKQWADTAYNASMQLLATSIGVATDVTSVPTTDSADTIDLGPTSANGTGDAAGGGGGDAGGISSGNCTMAPKQIATQNQGTVTLPKSGKISSEDHLVTTGDTSFLSSWPTSAKDHIQEHYNITQTAIGHTYNHVNPWTPAEGGGNRGGGSGGKPPANAEPWVMNMYWTGAGKPAAGSKMIIKAGNKVVVAAAGYETGPSSAAFLLGAQEEVMQALGVSHESTVTLGWAADQSLPFGPINCTN